MRHVLPLWRRNGARRGHCRVAAKYTAGEVESAQEVGERTVLTVAAYRNCFRLLLRFATARLGRSPSELLLVDLDAALIAAFLDHLEHDRGNSPRTRNARLAAIHAFFRYVALTEPAHALQCQRVLAIPSKRWI